MSIPPSGPFSGQGPFNPDIQMLSEIRTTNQLLEILIALFGKAFPQLLTPEVNQQIEDAKKPKPIGFGRP
jgi:hypothetical protein